MALSSHFVARENVEDPAQVLIALTSLSPGAERVLADWPDGTLAEYALMPAEAVTLAEGLDTLDAAHLAASVGASFRSGGCSSAASRRVRR